jgi:hypothetical protein
VADLTFLPALRRVAVAGFQCPAAVERDRRHWQDVAAAAMLVLLGLILFRSQVFGDGLYIGNPDRLNSNLKILKFHLDGLSGGHLDAWSPLEMLGYDTFALPYTFPSIFTLLAYLIGPEKLYVGAGYQLPVLLSLAGLAAYAFLRVAVAPAFAAFVGAILYQFSAITILKISQNDLSFAVFIFIPILLIVIRKANAQSTRLYFLLLTALIFLLLHFTFLQKASYAMILAGSYCLYRSFVEHDWKLSAVFAAACVVAVIGAFPRLYGIALAMREYSRIAADLNFSQFADVYRFQSIFPSQILRWFDVGIFGRYPSDGNLVLQNYHNLTEGFLLYTSSFVPFLLLFGPLVYRDRPFALIYSRRNDGSFFFWFLAFTISVIVVLRHFAIQDRSERRETQHVRHERTTMLREQAFSGAKTAFVQASRLLNFEPEDLSGNLIVQLGTATEELNRTWYERSTGRRITDVQRQVKHSVIPWMAATLDGVVHQTGTVFESKFMLTWSFSEEAAAGKYI